jgi:opacity protein-like surface antigen
MKKIIILICSCCFIFSAICPELSGAPGRGFSFGINVGIFPIEWHLDTFLVDNYYGKRQSVFLFGGELGYQFTERIRIIGEFAYGRESGLNKTQYDTGDISYMKATYSSMPVSASLLFITPVNKRASFYMGIGLGYYKIISKSEYGSMGEITYSYADKIRGLAPHINFGIESALSKRISFFSEVIIIVGKTKLKYEGLDFTTWRDVRFGGPEIKIGARLYFKSLNTLTT